MFFGCCDSVWIGDFSLDVRDREKSHLGLNRLRFDEGCNDRIIFDGNVVEATSSCDFESGSSGRIGFVEFDETGNRSVDSRAVEVRVRIVGSEVGARDFVTFRVPFLWQGGINISSVESLRS